MGSSEVVGSGRVRSGAFSLTCNRLSRYLKEKRGDFGDVELVLTPRQQYNMEPKGTMNLLPMIEKSRDGDDDVVVTSDVSLIKSDAAKTAPQMTIFYGGRVMLFEDLPASKAVEIITLAAKASASSPRADRSVSPPLDSDLPIARRKSVSRFLDKRKDRVTANAPSPYHLVVKAEGRG